MHFLILWTTVQTDEHTAGMDMREYPCPYRKSSLGIKRPQIPISHTLPLHLHARAVVTGHVVMNRVGTNFVPAHAAAGFVPSFLGHNAILQFLKVLGDPLAQCNPRIAAVGVLAPFGRLDADARWLVRQHHAGLGLVAVLSARARVLGETHLNVFLVDFVGSYFGRIAHNHRYGGSVHAAFAFVGRHALPAVASAFLVELIEDVFVFRPNFGEESAGLRGQHAPLPALRQCVFFVELRLDGHQKFGVVAAFGSANFNVAGGMCEWSFHDVQLKMWTTKATAKPLPRRKKPRCSGTSRMGEGDQEVHGHSQARFAWRSGGGGCRKRGGHDGSIVASRCATRNGWVCP